MRGVPKKKNEKLPTFRCITPYRGMDVVAAIKIIKTILRIII